MTGSRRAIRSLTSNIAILWQITQQNRGQKENKNSSCDRNDRSGNPGWNHCRIYSNPIWFLNLTMDDGRWTMARCRLSSIVYRRTCIRLALVRYISQRFLSYHHSIVEISNSLTGAEATRHIAEWYYCHSQYSPYGQ